MAIRISKNRVALSGIPLELAKSASIASAATVDLSTATGNEVHITGATGPITSLGTVPAGTVFTLIFDSTPTINYDGTAMVLNTGTANYTCAAGDRAIAVSEGAGNWVVTMFKKDGTAATSIFATDSAGNITGLMGPDSIVTPYLWASKPSGDSATDIANMQAVINALPSTGGQILLHGDGLSVYDLGTSQITFDRPITLRGAGGRLIGDASTIPRALTTIIFSGSTGSPFSVLSSGCTFSDFALVNTSVSTPTAGCGIQATTLANNFSLERVAIIGFYNNLEINGQYYTIDNCQFLDFVHYGLLMDTVNSDYYDHGDMAVLNSVFTSYYKTYNSASACRWVAGGGLRFIGNKINGGYQVGNPSAGKQAIGLEIAIKDGCGDTGVFTIVGNSIENCTSACIKIRNQVNNNTDIVEKVVITGNEFLAAAGANCIFAGATGYAGGTQLRELQISGNCFSGGSAPISITAMNGLSIGDNFYGYVNSVTYITLAGYIINANIDVSRQCGIQDSDTVIVNDTRNINGDLGLDVMGDIDYSAKHRVHISTAATPYQIGYITLASDVGGAATLEVEINAVEIDGSNAHVGTICGKYVRTLTCVAGVSALSAITIGTDLAQVTGTAAYSVAFNVGTAGKCAITISMTTATHKIGGIATIKANGMIQKFALGT